MSPGELLADRFEIEQLAGAGGAGRVYRARDRRTGEIVAVKVLHGDEPGGQSSRFEREAHVLSALSHPGIVRYIAHGTTPGRRALARDGVARRARRCATASSAAS